MMLSVTRVAVPGLEFAQVLVSAMVRLKKAKLAPMELAPSGASGVTSVNVALNAVMGPSHVTENASELGPVWAIQLSVKSAATVIVLAGQIGQNGQFVVSPVVKENIIELENVAVLENARVMLSIAVFVTWVTVQPGLSGRIGPSALLNVTEETEVEAENVMAVTTVLVLIAMLWNVTFELVPTGQLGVSGPLVVSPVGKGLGQNPDNVRATVNAKDYQIQMNPVTTDLAPHGLNGATGILARSVVVVVIALDLVTVTERENALRDTLSKKDAVHWRIAEYIVSGLSGHLAVTRV